MDSTDDQARIPAGEAFMTPYRISIADSTFVQGPDGGAHPALTKGAALLLADRLNAAHAAGLASRDAEIAGLRTALQKIVQIYLSEVTHAVAADEMRFTAEAALAAAPGPVAKDAGTSHLIGGEFQSDKYPTTPRGKVPLSTKDVTAQDLLWEYAQRRRAVDVAFAVDLEQALRNHGYVPGPVSADVEEMKRALEFYADPFNRKDEHGEPIPVPDFYSEMDFGDYAGQVLSRLNGTESA